MTFDILRFKSEPQWWLDELPEGGMQSLPGDCTIYVDNHRPRNEVCRDLEKLGVTDLDKILDRTSSIQRTGNGGLYDNLHRRP